MKKPKTPRAKVIKSESTVRVSSRIDNELYLMLKMIYGNQGWTMENRINELLEKDYEYLLRQKWVSEVISKSKGNAFDKYIEVREKLKTETPANDTAANLNSTSSSVDSQFGTDEQ